MRGMQWAVSRHPIPHGTARYVRELAATESCTWLVESQDRNYPNRPARCPDHNLPIDVEEAR